MPSGTPGRPDVTPKPWSEATGLGSTDGGTPKMARRSSLHDSAEMSYSRVREALPASREVLSTCGQPPDQPGVDGPQTDVLDRYPDGQVIENPSHLGRREHRVDPQRGPFPDQTTGIRVQRFSAPVGAAAILPADHRAERARRCCACQPTTVSRWVDNAIPTIWTSHRPDRHADGLDHAGPDPVGVLLDPTRMRRGDADRRGAGGDDVTACADQDRLGVGGALVDRQDHRPLVRSGFDESARVIEYSVANGLRNRELRTSPCRPSSTSPSRGEHRCQERGR